MSRHARPSLSVGSRFKVVIHNGELAQIRHWVLQYPGVETGGDLFGLWSKDDTVVVQLVLGPGRQSRRHSTFKIQVILEKCGPT